MAEISNDVTIENIQCTLTSYKFELEDMEDVKKVFDGLQENNKILKRHKNTRRHNIHEFITEGATSYFLGYPRKVSLKKKEPTKPEKDAVKNKQKKYIEENYGCKFKNQLNPEDYRKVDAKFYPKLPSFSFDNYDLENNKTVQVKAATGLTDKKGVLEHKDDTSFGPRSKFDKFIFLDFFSDGKIDGKFKVYDIDVPMLLSTEIKNGVTFEEELHKNKISKGTESRPHFSILNCVINPNKLDAIAEYDLRNP